MSDFLTEFVAYTLTMDANTVSGSHHVSPSFPDSFFTDVDPAVLSKLHKVARFTDLGRLQRVCNGNLCGVRQSVADGSPNVAFQYSFSTGDFTPPLLSATVPANNEPSHSLSHIFRT